MSGRQADPRHEDTPAPASQPATAPPAPASQTASRPHAHSAAAGPNTRSPAVSPEPQPAEHTYTSSTGHAHEPGRHASPWNVPAPHSGSTSGSRADGTHAFSPHAFSRYFLPSSLSNSPPDDPRMLPPSWFPPEEAGGSENTHAAAAPDAALAPHGAVAAPPIVPGSTLQSPLPVSPRGGVHAALVAAGAARSSHPAVGNQALSTSAVSSCSHWLPEPSPSSESASASAIVCSPVPTLSGTPARTPAPHAYTGPGVLDVDTPVDLLPPAGAAEFPTPHLFQPLDTHAGWDPMGVWQGSPQAGAPASANGNGLDDGAWRDVHDPCCQALQPVPGRSDAMPVPTRTLRRNHSCSDHHLRDPHTQPAVLDAADDELRVGGPGSHGTELHSRGWPGRAVTDSLPSASATVGYSHSTRGASMVTRPGLRSIRTARPHSTLVQVAQPGGVGPGEPPAPAARVGTESAPARSAAAVGLHPAAALEQAAGSASARALETMRAELRGLIAVSLPVLTTLPLLSTPVPWVCRERCAEGPDGDDWPVQSVAAGAGGEAGTDADTTLLVHMSAMAAEDSAEQVDADTWDSLVRVAQELDVYMLLMVYTKTVLQNVLSASLAWLQQALVRSGSCSSEHAQRILAAECDATMDALQAQLQCVMATGEVNPWETDSPGWRLNMHVAGSPRPEHLRVPPGSMVATTRVQGMTGVAVAPASTCPWAAAAMAPGFVNAEFQHLVKVVYDLVSSNRESMLRAVVSQQHASSAHDDADARASASSPSGENSSPAHGDGGDHVQLRRLSITPAVDNRSVFRRRHELDSAESPWAWLTRRGRFNQASQQDIFGTLSTKGQVMKPVVLRDSGVVIGTALLNEAQQHLTLTQPDGSEPSWRAATLGQAVSHLQRVSVLDSRISYVHCKICPRSDDSRIRACVPGRDSEAGADPSAAQSAASRSRGGSSGGGQTGAASGPGQARSGNRRGGGWRRGAKRRTSNAELYVFALQGVRVNKRLVLPGTRVQLKDGDVISLSDVCADAAPLEYTYHSGNCLVRAVAPQKELAEKLPAERLSEVPLCQICCGLPRGAVEMRPCGHTFCTPCLSQYLASALGSAGHVQCVHGCPESTTIAASPEVDAFVAAWQRSQGADAGEVWAARAATRSTRGEEVGDSSDDMGSPATPSWLQTYTPFAPGVSGRRSGVGARASAADGVDADAAADGAGSGGADASQLPGSAGRDVVSPVSVRSMSQRHEDLSNEAARDPTADSRGPHGSNPAAPFSTTAVHMHLRSQAARAAVRADAGGREGGCSRGVHPLVPLSVDSLPLSMQTLLLQQVDYSSRTVKQAAESGVQDLAHLSAHLRGLARGALNTSLFKEELNRVGTVEDSVAILRHITASRDATWRRSGPEFVAAVALLAASMVLTPTPGAEEVCQGNQWRAARAGVVEALVAALKRWADSPVVAHGTLQCLVALCKDNAMMKAHMTVVALKPVLAALRRHGMDPAVAERGFTLLGVLQSGGDHMNDGVRQLQVEAGLFKAVIDGVRWHAGGDERALAAVCFSAAMVLRGGEKWRGVVKWKAARTHLLEALVDGEEAYLRRCKNLRQGSDAALSALIAFLILYLEPLVEVLVARGWHGMAAISFGASAVLFATLAQPLD